MQMADQITMKADSRSQEKFPQLASFLWILSAEPTDTAYKGFAETNAG